MYIVVSENRNGTTLLRTKHADRADAEFALAEQTAIAHPNPSMWATLTHETKGVVCNYMPAGFGRGGVKMVYMKDLSHEEVSA